MYKFLSLLILVALITPLFLMSAPTARADNNAPISNQAKKPKPDPKPEPKPGPREGGADD